ncbi:uncharacterized protein F5147DRAFT_649683 [Suillus discolor]|uniref:Uncharacterized protein n=1 Tax=Suillus discolor TaxID=1912936 RepID=A0A9P7JXL2_9AGAM|nr:uncharacterized protein F5147DRAFT_649683 [Suillus discolor]KAG2115306.1 hypothetical protein F5147DRAFT_649683 [Suillus discolor]
MTHLTRKNLNFGCPYNDQASLSLEHCAIILEALQNLQSNTIVISGITPAEYAAVLVFTSEERDFEVQAKFAYFKDTQELQIMPPLPVHEQPAAHLSKAINKFMDALPYNKLLVHVTIHLNHHIQNKVTTNIPDLHLIVMIQLPEDDSSDDMEISKPVSKWIEECGLLSDYDFMVQKLRIMCDGHHNIDLALIMSFKEQVRWQQPKETSIAAQTLSCSLQTLYPTVEMSDVKHMLRDGANMLKDYIISLMEGMSLEKSAIQLVHKYNPSFEPIWGAAVNQISSAIYLTAYCCYLDWCISQTAQSLSTGDQNTTTSISSDPTTLASLSDPTGASVVHRRMHPRFCCLSSVHPFHVHLLALALDST